MKKIFAVLFFGVVLVVANAGSLFVKLVDERENAVTNAIFYWKLPDQQEYQAFQGRGIQRGNGQLQRHPEGFVFNYEIGKSTFVGGDVVDIKVVAPGYEVKVFQDRIPDAQQQQQQGSPQSVVVMERREHNR